MSVIFTSGSNRFLMLFSAGILLCVGFYLGRYFSSPTVSPATAVEPAALNSQSCSEMEQFKSDFEEYQSLKNQAEKFKKADEILSKIMTVFLADLGLRQLLPAETPVPQNPTTTVQTQEPAPSSAPTTAPTEDTQNIPTAPNAGREAARLKRFEMRLINSNREADAKDALKSLENKDLFSALKSAEPLTDRKFEIIMGHYTGEISFFDNKPGWIIEWDMNLRKTAKGWQGNQLITLTDAKGQIFSRYTGDGAVKQLSADSNSQAIFVNVQGDDGYLQIYPVRHLDKIYGNYYGKKGLGEFVAKGTVVLQKIR